MLDAVTVSLPPMIAELAVRLDSSLAANLETAMGEIAELDRVHGQDLEALGILLLRTESVASSKIESVEASLDDYARALHGVRADTSAVSMVAATTALGTLMEDVTRRGRVTLDAITTAHATLMQDDAAEAAYSGRLRDMQNWIGGSDHSPRGALYVPPPPETVQKYMVDPLIDAVLRRRHATARVVVPLASALVAHRERCFEALTAYRRGDVVPIIAGFAASSGVAAVEATRSAARLREVVAEWWDVVGPTRSNGAVAKLLRILPSRPILSAEDACGAVDAPRSSVFAAVSRLHEAGVLRLLTDRKRYQVWGAAAILDEPDDLGLRIAAASP